MSKYIQVLSSTSYLTNVQQKQKSTQAIARSCLYACACVLQEHPSSINPKLEIIKSTSGGEGEVSEAAW